MDGWASGRADGGEWMDEWVGWWIFTEKFTSLSTHDMLDSLVLAVFWLTFELAGSPAVRFFWLAHCHCNTAQLDTYTNNILSRLQTSVLKHRGQPTFLLL